MRIKHKKLREWIDAGLISADQGEAIHTYEEAKRGGRFGRGLVGLALFSILTGVLSIIASNWYLIDGSVKIGTHILLNLLVGGFACWADKNGKDLWREGASLVFMGLTFTLIILIGQVYQLSGAAADAVIFWFVITLPFFLLMGKTLMTAVPWIIMLLTTLGYIVFDKLKFLSDADHAYVAYILMVLLPIAFLALGISPRLNKAREALASAFLRVGFTLTALMASAVLMMWQEYDKVYHYNDFMISQGRVLLVMLAGAAALTVHAVCYRLYRDNPVLKIGAIFAGVSLPCSTVPLLIPMVGGDVFSALAFIAYWMFIGWIAQAANQMRIVSLAVTVIALRIFVAYLELFGSLMQTGLGMIVGGFVLLGLMFGASKASKYIKKQGGGSLGKI